MEEELRLDVAGQGADQGGLLYREAFLGEELPPRGLPSEGAGAGDIAADELIDHEIMKLGQLETDPCLE